MIKLCGLGSLLLTALFAMRWIVLLLSLILLPVRVRLTGLSGTMLRLIVLSALFVLVLSLVFPIVGHENTPFRFAVLGFELDRHGLFDCDGRQSTRWRIPYSCKENDLGKNYAGQVRAIAGEGHRAGTA